jgi:hypothetical protein
VKRIVQHPDFMSNNLQNDIALMFVDGVIQETNGVSPACVTREMYTAGENCVTLGWGSVAHGIFTKYTLKFLRDIYCSVQFIVKLSDSVLTDN